VYIFGFLLFILVCFVSTIAKWLAGKTHLRNDLLCVEWDVKLDFLSLTIELALVEWRFAVFEVFSPSLGFLCLSLGFLCVEGLVCQYHSQVIGWKDSSPYWLPIMCWVGRWTLHTHSHRSWLVSLIICVFCYIPSSRLHPKKQTKLSGFYGSYFVWKKECGK